MQHERNQHIVCDPGASQIILELQVALITEPPTNVPEPSSTGSPESPPWGTSNFQDLNPSVARTQLFKKEGFLKKFIYLGLCWVF